MRMPVPLLILMLTLTGCASTPQEPAYNGNIQVLAVSNGQYVEGANCNVTTAAGNWQVVTPGVAPVGSPAGDLRVSCSKPGFTPSEVVYRPSPYGVSGGNPNFGVGIGGGSGNVGLGVGMNFPIGGRSNVVGGYPSQVAVEMRPLGAAPAR